MILGGEAPKEAPKHRGVSYSDELFTFQAKHSMMNSKKKHISSIKLLKAEKAKGQQIGMQADKDSQESHLEELRRHHLSSTMMLKNFTTKLIIKITGTFVQSMLSIAACIIYLAETYFENEDGPLYSESANQYFRVLEIVIAALFTLDYIWGLYIAKNKKKFLFNIVNIIDLFTIFPVFVSLIGESNFKAQNFHFSRILRAIRVFRILRLHRLVGAGKKSAEIKNVDKSEIKRKVIIIMTTLLAMIFIFTGILHSLADLGYFNFELAMPSDDQTLTFDAAFYFMVTIITTIAFGDIKPVSVSAKITVGIFLIIMIILSSKQLSDLSNLMKFNSQFRNAYNSESIKHIVVLGNITHTSLFKFLKEFYHPDHNFSSSVRVVIIQESTPSKEILAVLNNPVFEESVHFIQGNIFLEDVMKMAKINTCIGCFILNNQFNKDTRKDDTFALLACKAIREFRSDVQIYLQLCNPEFLRHSWADWDEVMSIQTFKMGLISANIFVPGISTFMSNLIISSGGSVIRKELDGITWLLEYSHGLSHEIYPEVEIPEKYVGCKFIDLVTKLYFLNGSVLIGIKTYYGMKIDEIGRDDESIADKKQKAILASVFERVAAKAVSKKFFGKKKAEDDEVKLRSSFDNYDIIINPFEYTIKKGDKGVMISKSLMDAEEALKNQGENEKKKKKKWFLRKSEPVGATTAEEADSESPKVIQRSESPTPKMKGDDLKEKTMNVYMQEVVKNGLFQKKKQDSFGTLNDDHFIMWKVDLRGIVFDHIIVIGKIEHYANLLEYIALKTHQYVCFLNRAPPGEDWPRIKKKFPRAVYLECDYKNVEDLARAAINYSAQVVLLTWQEEGSVADSEIVSIGKIIEENFTCNLIVELVEEHNMRFLKHRPNGLFDGLNYNMWPRYAASTVFFSSSIDSLMGQAFHSASFVGTVAKLVCPDTVKAQKDYNENLDMNLYLVPDGMAGKVKYGDLFKFFCSMERPIIPLAIIRSANNFENELPYVFCNPNQEAPLVRGDKILILGVPYAQQNLRASSLFSLEIKKTTEDQSGEETNRKRKQVNSFMTSRANDVIDTARE